jgi:urease accessory protein
MNLRKTLYAIALFCSPALAFAHPGHGHEGLMAGLAHPVFGLDHLLAMFAVGLWAAQQSGAARWALPVTGTQIPLMETGIAGSVLAFGLLVAVAARLPVAISVAMTALFALTHGVAHGLELPELASPFAYAIGFVVATAALHAVGFALVRFLPQAAAPLVRIAGAASAATGVWLLAS